MRAHGTHTMTSRLAALTLLAVSRLAVSAELPADADPRWLAPSPPSLSGLIAPCAPGSGHSCTPASEGGAGRPGAAGPLAPASPVRAREDHPAAAPLALQFVAEDPTAGLLQAMNLCDALARVGSRDHWQTQALSGVALSVTAGYWLSKRTSPLALHLLRRGLYIGIERRF